MGKRPKYRWIKKTLITLFVMVIINFFLPRMMPGDPFDFLAVEEGSTTVTLTEEQIQHYRAYYGMDKPVSEQFKDYLINLLKGDFGKSVYYNREVTEMVFQRIAWTLILVTSALAISSILGMILGMISAYARYHSKYLDSVLVRIMTIMAEIPDFILALFLLFFFAAKLGWFPLSGGITPFATHETTWEFLKDYIYHGILPCGALVLASVGDFYLLSRQSVMTVLKEPYIQTAQAKGLGKIRIIFIHTFINAFSPIVSRIFMQMGMMLGGAVLVENVFSYPGIGRLMREAVGLRDYFMIQGIFFYVGMCVLIFNIVADFIYQKTNRREVA